MHMTLTKYAIIFGIASAMLISAIFLLLYIDGRIEGYEKMLSLYGLSEYDRGMLQGTLDWWLIQRSMVFTPISYLLISTGIVTYIFGITARALSAKKEYQQKNIENPKLGKSANLQDQDTPEIAKLRNKVAEYQKKLAMSNHRINNLKENMDYLVKIINDIQEKSKTRIIT
jgi:hypothetical protein